jgi:FlaA1/EpsC-like NDP-sugar epimerase
MWQFAVSLLVCLAIDIVSLTAAFLFHFDLKIDADVVRLWKYSLPLVLLVKVSVFTTFVEWQHQFRHSLPKELTLIALTATLSSAILGAAFLLGLLDHGPPGEVIIIDWVLTLVATAITRATIRLEARYWGKPKFPLRQPRRAILYGADSKSISLVNSKRTANLEFEIVAVLDVSNVLKKTLRTRIPIVNSFKSVSGTARRFSASHVIIPENLPGPVVRKLNDECRKRGLVIRVFANTEETERDHARSKLRNLSISDLYRADHAHSDLPDISESFAGKTVLVTGAAGCIGSECCRQILDLNPKVLILVDQSLRGLRELEFEFTSGNTSKVDVVYTICDVNDQVTLGRIMGEYLPDLVFHAASHDDSRFMANNVQSAIRNNILGTRSVVDLAERFGVDRFIMVSSHKAFAPTEIVGATEQIAEQYVQAMAVSSKTAFVTIRVGKVLGASDCQSRLLQRQIQDGGPIRLGNPEMSDVWTAAPDLVHDLLRAAVIGRSGQLLTLDQGQSLKIVDLAKDLIALAGLRFPEEIDIVFVGTPADQIFDKAPIETDSPKISNVCERIYSIERPEIQSKEVKLNLQQLERASHGDAQEARSAIQSVIAEFPNRATSEPNNRAAIFARGLGKKVA